MYKGGIIMKRLLLIVVILLIGCTPVNTYCPKDEATIAYKELTSLSERWKDGFNLAASTSRMNLPTVIESLQSIKQDTNALEVPECLYQPHYQFVRSMEAGIDAFIAFMSEKPDFEISEKLKESNSFMDYAIISLEK